MLLGSSVLFLREEENKPNQKQFEDLEPKVMPWNQIPGKTGPLGGRVPSDTEQGSEPGSGGRLKTLLHGLGEEERNFSGVRSVLRPNSGDTRGQETVQFPLDEQAIVGRFVVPSILCFRWGLV